MTKSDKGSEVIAILNKVTFEQRLEVRKGRMRTFVESLFLVVERTGWSMWQEQNDDEDNDRRQPHLAGTCRPGEGLGILF